MKRISNKRMISRIKIFFAIIILKKLLKNEDTLLILNLLEWYYIDIDFYNKVYEICYNINSKC